ncbi:MAG TPA: hypothetical protein VH854_05115 [Thermoanaerobaculia bacterium]|nr:hypothetical protein [Thermoanaerobaculia bacterium]
MRYRAVLFAASLCVASVSSGQSATSPPPPEIWQLDLVPTGTTFAATQPVLKNGVYTFQSWPEHVTTHVKRERVSKVSLRITRELSAATVYQIDLNPSGQVVSRVQPVQKGNFWIYRSFRDGTTLSLRAADVRKITPLSGEAAYWATEHAKGEVPIGPLAMEGGGATVIASPAAGGAQGGPQSLSSLNRSGNSGAPVGNWTYQGTPGTSDAYGPANATVASPGGVPQAPAATSGAAPPK